MFRLSSEQLAITLLFCAAGALALQAPAHSDTWWLLRAGQDIATTLAVPMIDTYSYTVAGQPWPNHEWLTELLFYVLFATGGLPFVTSLCAAAIVSALALSWRLCKGDFEWKFLLMSAALASMMLSWALRPQALTTLCLLTAVTLLVRRRWRWLPLLFLIWANLHGGVALGFVAIAGAMVADIILSKRVSLRLLAFAGLSAVATCLTPNGLSLWTFVFHSVQRLKAFEVLEWRMPDAGWQFSLFWILAATLPLLTIWRQRHLNAQSFRLVIIALSLMPLAVQSMRNVPPFLLVAVPALTRFLPQGRRHKEAASENPRVNAAVAAAAAVVVMTVTLAVWMAPTKKMNWRPLSAAALAALDTCPDRIFNTFGNGGQLIWFAQHRKIFIDNRQDPYPAAFFAEAHGAELGQNVDGVFARYGVRCAVVPPDSTITSVLANDSSWNEIYRDDRVVMFAR